MSRRTRLELLLVAALAVVVVALGPCLLWRRDTYGERGSGLSSRFEYNLDPYHAVDPAKIGYREVRSIAVELEQPRAVAVGPHDRIYVAGDRAVRVYDAQGQALAPLAISGEPTCLAVASREHKFPAAVYVGVAGHVLRWDDQGNLAADWTDGLNEKSVLTSLAVAEDDVFVADAGNRVVLRLNLEGKLVTRIGEAAPDRNRSGLVIPSPYFDVALTTDGLLRVANPGALRIETYTFDGDLLGHWGTASADLEGFFGCCNPANFAMLPDGRFVTVEKGLSRVKVYGGRGEFECVVAAPRDLGKIGRIAEDARDDQQAKVFDVATDSQGRVLLLDPTTRCIRVFEKKA
jgi:hypothetical protein